ncbi:hypothetical protein ACHAQA_007889 [Verticillium albo-atrum]
MNTLRFSRTGRPLDSDRDASSAGLFDLGPGCDRCQSLSKGTRWRLEVSVSDLRAEAATEGGIRCPGCRLLWDGAFAVLGLDTYAYESFEINERGPDIAMGPLSVHVIPGHFSRGYPHPDGALDGPSGGKVPRVELQFYTPHDVEARSPWTTVGKGYHIAPEGLADSCVELAYKWLDECTTGRGKHNKTECLAAAQIPYLPKRVIDVELNRLYEPSSSDEKHRYAALSHCWGGSTPVRTTRDTLAAHLEALPSPLPATFGDAIEVTLALGLRYLWIDSLCIIQDDTDDWRREASHMANIYENAVVTISADAATCSTDGFLSKSTRQTKDHAVVTYVIPDAAGGPDITGDVCVRERGTLGLLLPYHGLSGARSQGKTDQVWTDEPDAPRSVLSTRGWVFQERILAPRTLHFSEFEMAWECRSICTCECSATSYRPYVDQSLLKGLLSNHDDMDYFRTLWRVEVVQEYSRMALTFPEEDRLVAMAGLATAVARLRPGDEYLAGLWRETLGEDLLWAMQPIQGSIRLAKRPAASWSWGAITGAVAYGRSSRSMLVVRSVSPSFTINAVNLRKSDESRFSDPLAGSELHVTGRVIKGTLVGETEKNKVMFRPEGWVPRGTSSRSSSEPRFGPFQVAWDVMTGESSGADLAPYRSKQLLFLMMAEQPGGPCGLLLEEYTPASGSGSDSGRLACRRVGYVYSEGDSSPIPRRRGSYPDLKAEEREDRALMTRMWEKWTMTSTRMALTIV